MQSWLELEGTYDSYEFNILVTPYKQNFKKIKWHCNAGDLQAFLCERNKENLEH